MLGLDPELRELLVIIAFGLGVGSLFAAPVLIFRRLTTGKWFPDRSARPQPAWLASPLWHYGGILMFGSFATACFFFLAMPYYGVFFLLLAAWYFWLLARRRGEVRT